MAWSLCDSDSILLDVVKAMATLLLSSASTFCAYAEVLANVGRFGCLRSSVSCRAVQMGQWVSLMLS